MQKQPGFEAIELRDKYELSVIVAKVGLFAHVAYWLALSIGGIPSALNVVLWNVLVLSFLFALFLIPPLIFHWFKCSGKARLPFWRVIAPSLALVVVAIFSFRSELMSMAHTFNSME